jgi:hypothetical protein
MVIYCVAQRLCFLSFGRIAKEVAPMTVIGILAGVVLIASMLMVFAQAVER